MRLTTNEANMVQSSKTAKSRQFTIANSSAANGELGTGQF